MRNFMGSKFENNPIHHIGKVNVKIPDTYEAIVSSPKQFDRDRSKVKATETAHFKGMAISQN